MDNFAYVLGSLEGVYSRDPSVDNYNEEEGDICFAELFGSSINGALRFVRHKIVIFIPVKFFQKVINVYELVFFLRGIGELFLQEVNNRERLLRRILIRIVWKNE